MYKFTIAMCVLTSIVAIAILTQTVPMIRADEPVVEFTEATEVTEATESPATEPTITEPPVTEPTVTESPITEPSVATTLYDVPLSEDLQLHIIGLAERFGIDPAIVIAMAWRESRFNAASVGDNGESLGLMQIKPRWHSGWMEQLNCPDLLNPFQNVTVCIHILATHLERYDGDIGMALTSYNAGATGAYNHYFSKGIYANDYALEVMAYADEIR